MTEQTPPGTPRWVDGEWCPPRPIGNLAAALSKAQGEFPPIPKDSEGVIKGKTKDGRPYEYKYKYADLTGIIKAVSPALAKYELAQTQLLSTYEGGVVCTTKLMHSSGESIETSMRFPSGDSKPHSIGAACTYPRRYCLSAILGVSADDDDDAQGLQQEATRGKPRAAPRKPGEGRAQQFKVTEPGAPAKPSSVDVTLEAPLQDLTPLQAPPPPTKTKPTNAERLAKCVEKSMRIGMSLGEVESKLGQLRDNPLGEMIKPGETTATNEELRLLGEWYKEMKVVLHPEGDISEAAKEAL